MDLSQSVGIITGASAGIGHGVAKAVSEAGAKLMIAGRRAEKLEELAAELKSEAVCMAGDITEPGMSEKLIDTATGKFGKVDFALNNAGVMQQGPVEAMTDQMIESMVRINIEASFKFAHAIVRHWKSAGSKGYLINTSSILGTKNRDTAGVYAGTKHAIEALTESLRIELGGSGIRVGCIEPGVVATDLFRDFKDDPIKRFGLTAPLTPADLGLLVRFMLEAPDHVLIPRVMILPAEQKM